MSHPQLTEIGTIQRTHGVNGEVQIAWTNDFDPDEHKIESVFLLIEGIPIPFFIKSLRSKGRDASLINFDEVETMADANDLVGLRIFAEIKRKAKSDEVYLEDLVGYTIITNLGVKMGEIDGIHDYSGNLVFQVKNSAGNEVLIPATPDFILELDEDSKTLIMELPEGLADL